MKSGKRILMTAVWIFCGALVIRGALEPWVQHVAAGPAIAALFRSVPMPGGAVPILRPPAEARPALTHLISSTPREAMLYRLRAQQAEMALDFTAAEADWKTYAQYAADRYSAEVELADFYQRRAEPREEIAALKTASTAKDDPLQPATAQQGWRAFERMASVAEQEALPTAIAEPIFREWVARYPKELAAWRKLIEYLSAHRQFAAAETEITRYERTFHDDLETVKMRADLELRRGSPDAALAVYDRAFQPLWPRTMTASYFSLLEQQQQLREFAGRARTALASNPTDLNATARLFDYFQAQNNIPAARRVLLEYRIAKESGQQPWAADELQTVAQLFERLPDVNEAARLYYALYSVVPASAANAEESLNGLAHLLLTAPEQPIQFGSGDLSFYKDIATIDPSPGFLNGILSLLLNSTGPRWEYQSQNEKSAAYFHRAAAAQLVKLLEQRFPQSKYRAPLRAQLVSAYGAYGDDVTVIRAGREYLAAFPDGADRVAVALQVSDALARQNRTTEEFVLYDQLLRELAANASGVPIGANAAPAEQLSNNAGQNLSIGMVRPFAAGGISAVNPLQMANPRDGAQDTADARSREYVQVLDKYLSRLAALHRPLDVLRVYRAEIDRNPNDPGLYQWLAAYLEQNGTARDVEDVYNKAIAKFADRSWYNRLARWYLRRKETSALETTTQRVIAVFSGTDLEAYFREIVSQTHPDAALYRQLNLYAHERFPEDLVFVYNLLDAYSRRETYDAAAADRLLRQYWFYDSTLRPQYFARLSQQGRLIPALSEVRAANPAIASGQFGQAVTANPAAVQFDAEAEAWLSHFETAAPAARALATVYPGIRDLTSQASSLYRSLAAYYKQDTNVAITLAGYERRANPRDENVLARMGDIVADRELFSRARTFWDRIPATQPGNREAYLNTATVYWDYYLYNDALRWIATARRKFGEPALFAYQAGAIYEGKRDDRGAIREYVAGALDGEDSARSRLLQLLRQSRMRGLVDRATAAAASNNPSPEAVSLRVAVLEAEQRRPDLEKLLQSRVNAAKSSAELTDVQEDARRLGFDGIEERASERLAEINTDPVDKMRLTLTYARLLESKKDIAGAARVVDGLYHDHPLILGVVRGAVDLHVRNKQPDAAIDILLDAAKRARSDLAAQFTLESARIATAAGQFDRARTLLAGLLSTDALRTEYLAAMADTYLQAKDDRGFRDYQLAIIARLKQSQLTAAERTGRIAAIRRSLIPALDRLKDSAGVVDQYVEIINSYPEDESVTKEAAAYAVAHGETARLVDFYRKTATAAPLDYRWPIVLGRIETVAEDFPAAIADYQRAMKARPNRADVLTAQAGLEERLMRFDDAMKSYSKLYELAYRDPQWMIKVAELRARSGQSADAVTALKTAIIGARTETADADFTIAGYLESWHILPDAIGFAEQGANLAGADLWKDGNNASVYARLMARARRMEPVLAGMSAETGAEYNVVSAAGPVIAETYTPEEKARFEQALIAQAGRVTPEVRNSVLLPLATAARLVDLEARWRRESMEAQKQQIDQSFVNLQKQRGVYNELGRQLEEYAAANPGQPVAESVYVQAAQAFAAEGEVESEMRMMRTALEHNSLSGALLNRYLLLLAGRAPQQLLAVIRGNGSDGIRNQAVQSAIAGNHRDLAYSAIRTRGSALSPIWTKAYLALAGQYFNDHSAAIDAGFQSALDTRTIGERLQSPPKPDSTIVGSAWFYYGERYGEYLDGAKNADAEAWLPAIVEDTPGNPDAYMALGDFYAGAAQPAEALVQFGYALELDPDRADADDHMARVLWDEGRHPEAIARWKAALATYLRIQSRGVRVPEPFWKRAAETFTDIGERHAMNDLHGDIAGLLADYYQRNNQYRFRELIEPAARASIASGQGTAWLVAFARTIDDPEMVINVLMKAPGVGGAERISLQRELVAMRTWQVQSTFGDERQSAEAGLVRARWQLASMLLDEGDVRGAQSELNQIPAEDAKKLDRSLEIRLASRAGTLDALLARYGSDAESTPSAEMLRNAAVQLRKDGDENSARSVLEFLYRREIQNGNLDASNFLGLAEVDLQRNNVAGALALLNRMTLVSTGGFDTLLPAAELLAKYGKAADSEDFIRRRLKAAPWDSEAKVQLARTIGTGSTERTGLLEAAATDPQAAYYLRAEAARLSSPQPITGTSGTELALLSSSAVTADAATKPYQVEARIDAAEKSTDPQIRLRLWREALAIAPADESVRLGALRAAIALRRDSLALALEQDAAQRLFQSAGSERARSYRQYVPPEPLPTVQTVQLTDAGRATLAESLAAAAERVDELPRAQSYLRAAITLRPVNQRDALNRQLNALSAELDRRAKNATRRPVIKNGLEQDHTVSSRIAGGAQ
ncbi:MAG TPA: hypothetical protein VG675_05265 [Bryobacteraceae bacterium]|nr:hypothetical protein [Bryobacteraceae bacterium]